MDTEETVTVYSEPDRSTFVLNTENTCFLCLKDNCLNGHNNQGQGSNSYRINQCLDGFSLFRICRYLKIDLQEIVSDYLEIGDQKITDFSVTICKNCSVLTSKLSEFLLELELLQMKIDHCLQSVQDELWDSEMDKKGRVKKFRRMEQLEDVDVYLAEMLRNKIKTKCEIRLNSLPPKVLITEKVHQPPPPQTPPSPPPPPVPELPEMEILPMENLIVTPDISTILSPKPETGSDQSSLYLQLLPIPIPEDHPMMDPPPPPIPDDPMMDPPDSTSTPIRWKCGICISLMEFPDQDSLARHLKYVHPPSEESLQSEVPVPVIESRYKNPPTMQSGEQYLCTLCKPHLKVSVRIVSKHKIRKHIDILMIDYKLPHVSSKDFEIYANHIFKLVTVSSQKGVNSKGNPICYCPFCPMTYTSHEFLRIHLFSRHREILAERLIELQNNSSVEEVNAVELPALSLAATSGQFFPCEDCGQSFTYSFSLKRHKLHICEFGPKLEKPKTRRGTGVKLITGGRHQRYTCPDCPDKVFRSKHLLIRHQKKAECELGFVPPEIMSIVGGNGESVEMKYEGGLVQGQDQGQGPGYGGIEFFGGQEEPEEEGNSPQNAEQLDVKVNADGYVVIGGNCFQFVPGNGPLN